LGATGGQNQDPIGHTIEFGNMDGDLRLLTIVGIVREIAPAAARGDHRNHAK
jgi:hypothetical protein